MHLTQKQAEAINTFLSEDYTTKEFTDAIDTIFSGYLIALDKVKLENIEPASILYQMAATRRLIIALKGANERKNEEKKVEDLDEDSDEGLDDLKNLVEHVTFWGENDGYSSFIIDNLMPMVMAYCYLDDESLFGTTSKKSSFLNLSNFKMSSWV